LKCWRIEELAPYLNTQLYRRLQNKRKKKDLFLNTSDWIEVKEALQALKGYWIPFLKLSDPSARAMSRVAADNGVNLLMYEAESVPYS
jgi:hypothetical protein